MENINYKTKRFLLPILSLVLFSIILIACISSYITISMFKTHMQEHIEKTKNEYISQHKDRVYNEVHFVDDSIRFQISKIEDKLRDTLEEKVRNALNVANYIYNKYKNTYTKEEIKEEISKALKDIKFNEDRSYYFMYDNKTKIIFGHPVQSFVGKDMTNFKDAKGRSLMETDAKILEKEKIGFNKIYFIKPNNEIEEFPKITCITKFEPLDIVLGIGEYLDVVEKSTKEYVIERFSKNRNSIEDNYIVILDVHDLKGGNEFATVLLNKNRPELYGKKVSDEIEDIKGKKYRKDLLKLVNEKGEGYIEYWFKKPFANTPSLKLSYVFFQKDWNWIILSGFYYDDLKKEIAAIEKSIVTYKNHIINKTLLWVGLLSLIVILIAILVSFEIDKTIKKYTNTIIDYKDKKRKQEHLLIQQSKMAAMGEMLGNIAHQWRQPLSAISTASTGAKIQKEMDCLTDEQLITSLDAINNSAQYLSQTIEDFRSFFSPSNNSESVFKISELIKKTLNLINAQFTAKDIEIIQNIEDFELESIENELIQVLINILNNARDALLQIENHKRLLFINTYKNNNKCIIEIKDNANGVPEDIIERIFEPYFTTKHKSQGTGIGLYMSSEIVKAHLNGNLIVSNEKYLYENIEYTGAKFTIEISLD